jgi:hypothetical protein
VNDSRRGLGVRRVALHLVEEPQERLRLDVDHGAGVGLAGDPIVALKEETVQVLERLLPSAFARHVEHLVEVLRRPVVAGVLRIAEAVGEAVQRTRRRQRLVRLPSVHEVEQVRLDPAADDVGVVLKLREPLGCSSMNSTKASTLSSKLRERRLG